MDIIIDDDQTCNYLYSLISTISKEIPSAFIYQAGDILNLANRINIAINSTYTLHYINGDLDNNINIILQGVRDFLELKSLEKNVPKTL
jgi:hypothetical protein